MLLDFCFVPVACSHAGMMPQPREWMDTSHMLTGLGHYLSWSRKAIRQSTCNRIYPYIQSGIASSITPPLPAQASCLEVLFGYTGAGGCMHRSTTMATPEGDKIFFGYTGAASWA